MGLFVLCLMSLRAQEVSIEVGKVKFALNEPFHIQIISENEAIRTHDRFPSIQGFVKRGLSSSTSTQIANGRIRTTYSLTQNYYAQKEGTFQLPAFGMRVNGKEVHVNAQTLVVLPPNQVQNKPFYSLDDDIFGGLFAPSAPTEYVDVKADAFLSLALNKEEVYVGEGAHVRLALYVAEGNQAELQFVELGPQLSSIVQKLKPENAWEENFNIEQVERELVVLKGKRYSRYTLYEATFYPLSARSIEFSPVGLRLLKYKVAKNPSFFGRNRQEDYKTFYTRAQRLHVHPLPPHPKRESVAVGAYRLQETASRDTLRTGESLAYEFSIQGEGNISAIPTPTPREEPEIQFYTPNILQTVNRANGRVRGRKTFRFYIAPQSAGRYALSNYIEWIYFDPRRERYDTLRPTASFTAKGSHLQDQRVQSRQREIFYAKGQFQSNDLRAPISERTQGWRGLVAPILVGLLLMGVAAKVFNRKKTPQRSHSRSQF